MNRFILFSVFLILLSCQLGYAQSIDSVLTRLLNGNKRFMNQMAIHPNDDRNTLLKTSKSQKPFAIVHTCSDSRVSPELIFDQGIGDLFVTRVAGNVMGDGGLGSMEYAVEHLGVRFILILGHTKCGAVTATISGQKPAGHISWLTDKILPSYQKTKEMQGDIIDLTVIENVKHSMSEVMSDRALLDSALRNQIIIAGAVYHIEDGSIQIVVPPQLLTK